MPSSAEHRSEEETFLLSPAHNDERQQDALLAPGAPIEKLNPLGREVTLLSAVMLNLGRLLGSGIYSVPGSILVSVGSIGLLLTFWFVSAAFAFAGLIIYVELASMFPKRSGAEVVWLEQAYPKPRFLVPTMYAVCVVLLSFTANNAIVFAQYFLTICDIGITPYRQTVTAVGGCTAAVLVVGISTKWSLRTINFLTGLKVLSCIFMAAVGLAVLAGMTRVEDPYANFHDIFEGSTSNFHSLAIGVVKANYAYSGWQNAFYVLGEVKGPDPTRTIRKAGFISLSIVAALFVLINIAYVAAIPREEIRNSGQLVAALFFRHVFGDTWGAKMLPSMVALSTFGNIIAVTAARTRVLREVARQGLLPYPTFFVSTKPFGTPLGPVVLMYLLTVLIIVAVPGKDAFNFIVDLESYPNLISVCAVVIGVWILRRRRAIAGLSPSIYQAKNFTVVLVLLSVVFLLVMPWVPPEPGHSDVSFWYATYCVVGLVILAVCALYYYVWIIWLPRIGGYKIVEEVDELADGARATRLTRRYQSQHLDG